MITTSLSAYEVELLTSLVKQLVELVSDGSLRASLPGRSPPTTSRRWSPTCRATRTSPRSPRTSAQAAVPHGLPARPSSFIGLPFTGAEFAVQKVAEAQVVLDRLETTALGAHDLKIPRDEVEAGCGR